MSEITRIAHAVLSSEPLPPETGPAFEIYRNNYRHALVRALAQSFPVVEELVGEAFFRAMALSYLELTPPTTRLLRDYGDSFAGFIARFEPAEAVPYLADVARLEYGLVQAYYASDDGDDPVEDLSAVGVESRLLWRRSTQLIRSPYPIVSIWQAHKTGQDLAGLNWLPENGLIVRDAYTVGAHALEDADAVVADVFQNPTHLVTALECLGPDAAPAAAQAIRHLLDLQALVLINESKIDA